MSRRRTGFWTLVISGAVISIAAWITVSYSRSDRIFPGVTIAHNPIGGLTREEAEARIAKWSTIWTRHELALTSGDNRWTAPLRELGVHADAQTAVDHAYRVGRRGGSIRRLGARFGIDAPDIPLEFKADPRILQPILAKIAQKVNVPHRNARTRLVGDSFEIQTESSGIRLDEAATIKAVLSAVTAGWPVVEVVTLSDPPEITAKDLQAIDAVLASYTTRFPAWRRDRTHNIRMAAKEIDGTLIPPGEVFSYNDVVGPREKDRGYRDAPIFENGMLVPGTGGGVCQVSSTVYNAALLSNMEIIRRSHHSSEVPYVSKGRDATVAYGLLDLKFRNTASSPIYIATAVRGSRLTVAIYGSRKDKVDVAIHVLGGHKSKSGKSSVTVYRTVSENGALVKRELMSRDTYRPVVVADTKLKHQPKGQPASRKKTAATRPVSSG